MTKISHNNQQIHSQFMAIALGLAMRGQGQCSPNPAVGAVIVKNGKIIGRGWHQGPGKPHAEINALTNLTLAQTQNATIYVTLEPCNHHGRTPPCTQAIINAKITTVIYGLQDPNPIVAGSGIKYLTNAGITCHHLNLASINNFYDSYQNWHQHQRTHIIGKLAITPDGSYAHANKSPISITKPLIKNLTWAGRNHADVIITTSPTITNDNPIFSIVHGNNTSNKPIIILDPNLLTPLTARIFTNPDVTILYDDKKQPNNYPSTTQENTTYQHHLQNTHSNHPPNPKSQHLTHIPNYQPFTYPKPNQPFPWDKLQQYLAEQGYHTAWFEGGGYSWSELANSNNFAKLILYIGTPQPQNDNNLTIEKNGLHQTHYSINYRSRYGVDQILYFIK